MERRRTPFRYRAVLRIRPVRASLRPCVAQPAARCIHALDQGRTLARTRAIDRAGRRAILVRRRPALRGPLRLFGGCGAPFARTQPAAARNCAHRCRVHPRCRRGYARAGLDGTLRRGNAGCGTRSDPAARGGRDPRLGVSASTASSHACARWSDPIPTSSSPRAAIPCSIPLRSTRCCRSARSAASRS